jgi:FO synthase
LLCPDKLSADEWIAVMRAVHGAGLKSTATIMFGHVDTYAQWATHLLRVRDLAEETGGFTEFVPLPFVAHEAPIFKRGLARRGPSFREAVLMHAVARLVLGNVIPHIQTSWVKMGAAGAQHCLVSGADDLGGTLMNETITRSAGARHGQEMGVQALEALAREIGRPSRQRTTLYADAPVERTVLARRAAPLEPVRSTPAARRKHAPAQS